MKLGRALQAGRPSIVGSGVQGPSSSVVQVLGLPPGSLSNGKAEVESATPNNRTAIHYLGMYVYAV